MPRDTGSWPYGGWEDAYAAGVGRVHEDSEDRLNADRTWGPTDPGAPGQSGIVFGYATDDLEAVIVAERAAHNKPPSPPYPCGYNWEHWIRQIRYAVTAWEMTGDAFYAARIREYDDLATSYMSCTAQVQTGKDWIPTGPNDPRKLSQYLFCAQQNPHSGIAWNLREMGWIAYGHAMRMKVDGMHHSAWSDMLFQTCGLAAITGTGQLAVGGHDGINETDCEYGFHRGIFNIGVLGLCYRTGRQVPSWLIQNLAEVGTLTGFKYYDAPSPPAFVRSVDGELVAATGTYQTGDPGFWYWSGVCTTIAKVKKDRTWLSRATQWGPTIAVDENSRQLSLLYRGAMAGGI